MKKIGNFEVDVWSPYPCWCFLKYRDNELKFNHSEIMDLEYAVKNIKKMVLRHAYQPTKPDEKLIVETIGIPD